MKILSLEGLPKPLKTAYLGLTLTTLFFWTSLEDPFNDPKLWIMLATSGLLLGWLFMDRKNITSRSAVSKYAVLASLAFLAVMTISGIVSGSLFTSLYGEYGRRTGILCYLALVIYFIVCTTYVRLTNVKHLLTFGLVIGIILGSYGFLQHFGIDIATWNNPYNSVFSTLGNPNFAAAMMAICTVLCLGIVLNSSFSNIYRLLAVATSVLLLVVIYFSDALQGLLALAVGAGFFILVAVFQKNRIAGYTLTAGGLIAALFVLLGTLQMGPLSGALYKQSVTFRGDYWRAGLNMFKHNALFGVGPDQYGANFRLYRDAAQALRRGPNTVSTAAHNVPIQLAATGGIFLILLYVVIIALVIWRAVVALRSTNGTQQLLVATVFSAWLTYQAQSIISIDNVGIAIWGWVLGGAVIGLSLMETQDLKKDKKSHTANNSDARPVISFMIALVLILICLPMMRFGTSMHEVMRLAAGKDDASKNLFRDTVTKPLSISPVDPYYRLIIGSSLANNGLIEDSLKVFKTAADADKGSLEARINLAMIYEQTKRAELAIAYREQASVLDPWNSQNLLQLGRDYLSAGDATKAKTVIAKIQSFAPDSADLKSAISELG